MDNATIDTASVTIPVNYYGAKSVSFPVEILKSLAELGPLGLGHIEDALLFYTIASNAKSSQWVTADQLVGLDLTGYAIWAFVGEDEYSQSWQKTENLLRVEVANYGDGVIFINYKNEEILEGGEVEYRNGVKVLLVELSDEDRNAEVAKREAEEAYAIH